MVPLKPLWTTGVPTWLEGKGPTVVQPVSLAGMGVDGRASKVLCCFVLQGYKEVLITENTKRFCVGFRKNPHGLMAWSPFLL